jgi:molybdate transport system substrate-binding protein
MRFLGGARGMVVLLLAAAAVLAPAAASAADLLVFAAASLRNALDDADARFTQATGERVRASYAASSALAKQIEAGAPADLFISADLDWMDYLGARGLIRAETRSVLLGNSLVLVAPKESAVQLQASRGFPLAAALGEGRLALADPTAVPAGKYAKAALQSLGVWDSVAARLAPAENVRAALLLVERGETPLGIVYRTDAVADRGVRIVDTFPATSHPPILYPIAVTAASQNAAAEKYLAFLKSDAARPAFEQQGFTLRE